MERRKVEGHISKDVGRIEVLPKKLKVKLIAIQMENLHKIRNPVGDFDGIKLDEFDEIILVNESSQTKNRNTQMPLK